MSRGRFRDPALFRDPPRDTWRKAAEDRTRYRHERDHARQTVRELTAELETVRAELDATRGESEAAELRHQRDQAIRRANRATRKREEAGR